MLTWFEGVPGGAPDGGVRAQQDAHRDALDVTRHPSLVDQRAAKAAVGELVAQVVRHPAAEVDATLGAAGERHVAGEGSIAADED